MFSFTVINGYWLGNETFKETARVEASLNEDDPTAQSVFYLTAQTLAAMPHYDYLMGLYRHGFLYLIDSVRDCVLIRLDRRMSEYAIASGHTFSCGSLLH